MCRAVSFSPTTQTSRAKSAAARRLGLPYRVAHVSWWKEELPSPAEYAAARRSLAAAGQQVDFIVTHCAPTRVQWALGGDGYRPDALTDFLDEVADTCAFRKWFLDTTMTTA